MKIIIIEDDINKRRQIVKYLLKLFVGSEICEAKSYNSGLQMLLEEKFDLVLLDMTLPTFDIKSDDPGGRPRIFGGEDILRQMIRKKIYSKTILVTQFEKFGEYSKFVTLEELDGRLRREYPNIYLGYVYYSQGYLSWQNDLRDMLRGLGGLHNHVNS